MAIFTSLTNGWQVARASFRMLKAHTQLLLFPVLSGLVVGIIAWSFLSRTATVNYGVLFFLYIVAYFTTVFFNMALMHCARLLLEGKEASIAAGLRFSASRVRHIFLWSLFAATVGLLLKMLRNNSGRFGGGVAAVMEIAWSAATFFVIPVIAYEDAGPYDAVQRSAAIMKEKWGEGISANFSIGLICIPVFALFAIAGMGISQVVNEQAGIMVMAAAFLLLSAVGSALHSLLVISIYTQIRGVPVDQQNIDDLFTGWA
jgi:hypothetical protein